MNPDLDAEIFEVINWINKHHNYPQIYGIGVSMGAGILAAFLGRNGKKCGIKAAVA